jgi:hypothetical protein
VGESTTVAGGLDGFWLDEVGMSDMLSVVKRGELAALRVQIVQA